MNNNTVILAMSITAAGLFSCSAKAPSTIGIIGDRFHPCPTSPNCVSSFEKDKKHGIKPLVFSGDPDEEMKRLKAIVLKKPRASLVSETGAYMHFIFKSRLFRFIDDVEFLIDPGRKLIHIRSAARSGYSDMGVNRKRIEEIRTKFLKK